MIIRRHGYDPDIEVNKVGQVDITYDDKIYVEWLDENYKFYAETIESMFIENYNTLVLFTSENW